MRLETCATSLSLRFLMKHRFLANPSGGIPSDGFAWNLGFIRNLNDIEVVQVSDLIAVLNAVNSHINEKDNRVWKLDDSGVFSCKSLFAHLSASMENCHFTFFSFIWNSKCPMKIKVFCWLLTLGKLNTHDTLQRRRPFSYLSQEWCVM